MKIRLLFIVFLLYGIHAQATHNRAGEITYKQISLLTYEITVTTYTYTGPGVQADRQYLGVSWGDNTIDTIERTKEIILPNYYKWNEYKYVHTYPGIGTYQIVMEDPNRNADILNIDNSVDIKFAIKTILQINPQLGFNNTPILLNPPYDKAARGQIFIHNPGAYDPDGDSLSYKLTACLGDNGSPIPTYEFPASTNRPIYVDPISGDLVWDAPPAVGKYNIAMLIEEWRDGVKIGQITRDMQIEVEETENKPPQFEPLKDLCVVAGDTVAFTVTAFDDHGFVRNIGGIIDTVYDDIQLTAISGIFQLAESPPTFNQPVSGNRRVSSEFRWITRCSHVRQQPYQIVFKAEDNNSEIRLASYEDISIRVICPAPKNLTLEPSNSAILVKWSPSECTNNAGYIIYRKQRIYGYSPDTCITGVPAYTGYTEVGRTQNATDNTFLDDNNTLGLTQGFEYCYMITAYFSDGSESYPTIEVCTTLQRGTPVFTNVSVVETSTTTGKVQVIWAKPKDLDFNIIKPPFKYDLYRSPDLYGSAFQNPIEIFGIDDTTYLDQNLNTDDNPHVYKIGLYNQSPIDMQWYLVGSPGRAASPWLKLEPSDNSVKIKLDLNVPWINISYEIYRLNKQTSIYDLVGTTDTTEYTDTGLKNGEEYCYKVKSIGEYTDPDYVHPIINFSQIECIVPIDTTPPCSPDLKVTSQCDSLTNRLLWTNPNHYCSNDAVKYNIYYRTTIEGDLMKIASIDNPNDTVYDHHPSGQGNTMETMAGCYAVTAIDSFGNESHISDATCIDSCTYYKLPNVFTPDADGNNDLFTPFPYYFVEKVDMKIFNRWGTLVYQTTNPDINWDGKIANSSQYVVDGVYYYICDVYEYRLLGIIPRNIVGFVHIYRGKSAE